MPRDRFRRAGAIGLCLLAFVSGVRATPTRPSLARAAPRFLFRNGFWINLHHALLAEAAHRAGHEPLEMPADRLIGDEGRVWAGALDTYDVFKGRSVIFDRELVQVNDLLSGIPDDRPPQGLPAPVLAALVETAPIYRRVVWPAQQRTNADWIGAVEPAVARIAVATTDTIAAAYRTTWPAEPVVVDVTATADVHGGYTTVRGPAGAAGHTTIAASEPKNHGDMAIELIFHEASHTIDARIVAFIDAECGRQHVPVPADLWHAVLFYTAGDVVRRAIGKADDPSYEAYADRFGVYARGWQTYRRALERDWFPYLRGRTSFESALTALIHDSAATGGRGLGPNGAPGRSARAR
jgi:hypothetical protein